MAIFLNFYILEIFFFFTEEVVEHYTVSELWNDFGIVLDVIVSICFFFMTHF